MTVVGGVLGDGDGVFEVEVANGVSEPALSETKVVVGWVLDFVVFVFVFGDVLQLTSPSDKYQRPSLPEHSTSPSHTPPYHWRARSQRGNPPARLTTF